MTDDPQPLPDDDDDRPRRRRRRDDDDPDDRRPQSNGAATTALVFGVLSCCFLCLTGVPAIVFGIVGLSRASHRGGAGFGQALAGLILGGVTTVLGTPIGIGLMLPAIQKVRQAAGSAQSTNNLKQISLAAHFHENTIGHFPANAPVRPANPAAGAKPGDPPPAAFSWRVALLPYVEQAGVHSRIDFAQPWNGPANVPLAKTSVPAFAAPEEPGNPDTRYRGFAGRGTMFDPAGPVKLSSVLDGSSNTLFAVEFADAKPWPEPNDTPVPDLGPGRQIVVPPLGRPGSSTVLVLMVDGSIRRVRPDKMTPAVLTALVTRNGLETVAPDVFDR